MGPKERSDQSAQESVTDAERRQLRELGYLLIPGLLTTKQLKDADSALRHHEEIALVGRPTDAIILNGSVMHRTGANTSGSNRRSMFVSYVRNDASAGDRHSQIFTSSDKLLARLPDEARTLLNRV